ncbi:MAG: hypothetical protein NC311_09040 [Muribaculaceae bacterium]|nr:hypothetical protein [Muribaculaceae bacterium]
MATTTEPHKQLVTYSALNGALTRLRSRLAPMQQRVETVENLFYDTHSYAGDVTISVDAAAGKAGVLGYDLDVSSAKVYQMVTAHFVDPSGKDLPRESDGLVIATLTDACVIAFGLSESPHGMNAVLLVKLDAAADPSVMVMPEGGFATAAELQGLDESLSGLLADFEVFRSEMTDNIRGFALKTTSLTNLTSAHTDDIIDINGRLDTLAEGHADDVNDINLRLDALAGGVESAAVGKVYASDLTLWIQYYSDSFRFQNNLTAAQWDEANKCGSISFNVTFYQSSGVGSPLGKYEFRIIQRKTNVFTAAGVVSYGSAGAWLLLVDFHRGSTGSVLATSLKNGTGMSVTLPDDTELTVANGNITIRQGDASVTVADNRVKVLHGNASIETNSDGIYVRKGNAHAELFSYSTSDGRHDQFNMVLDEGTDYESQVQIVNSEIWLRTRDATNVYNGQNLPMKLSMSKLKEIGALTNW